MAAKAGVRLIGEPDRPFPARPDRGTPLPRSGRPGIPDAAMTYANVDAMKAVQYANV